MKIQGWLHIEDCGDGSARVNFFRTRGEANQSAQQELDDFGQALCDNVAPFVFDVDKEGRIVQTSGEEGLIQLQNDLSPGEEIIEGLTQLRDDLRDGKNLDDTYGNSKEKGE